MEADSTSKLRRTVRKTANKHPRLLLKKRRRTKAEMVQEKALKQMERALKEKEKDDDILRIAQQEDRMAIEDANADSAHPHRRDSCRRDGLSHFYPPLPPSQKANNLPTGRAMEGRVDRVDTDVDTTTSVVSQVKDISPLGDALSDLSDETMDDSPPKKKGRKITRTYALEDVTAPIPSIHEMPRAAKPTRARRSDDLDEGGRCTQKRRNMVRLTTHSLSETALTQRANHKERGTSVEIDMPITADESEASTGDEFVLLTDHPMTEDEELSVVESDPDPTPKKKG
jgi:hypothetical protein